MSTLRSQLHFHRKDMKRSVELSAAKRLRAQLNRMIQRIRAKRFRSGDYWEKRYAKGGTSGVGSYGDLARYKAEIVNTFVKENDIQRVIEFGCGDGHQLSHLGIPEYVGLDVSKTIIEHCRKMFHGDPTKRFFLYDNTFLPKNDMIGPADLTLSMDVLYHLVEDDVFFAYLDNLFGYSDRYVLIYSTNFDKGYEFSHQLDRKFTSTIQERTDDFKLVETINNPHKGSDTMSDWFVYRKLR